MCKACHIRDLEYLVNRKNFLKADPKWRYRHSACVLSIWICRKGYQFMETGRQYREEPLNIFATADLMENTQVDPPVCFL